MNKLTRDQRHLIVASLHLRRNYIETGDATMSAKSAEQMGLLDDKCRKALSIDQMRLIIEIDDLVTLLLNC